MKHICIFYHVDCVDGFLAAGTLALAMDPDMDPSKSFQFKAIQYNDDTDILLSIASDPRNTDFVFIDFTPKPSIVNALLTLFPKSVTILDHHADAMSRISQYPKGHPVRYVIDQDKCGTSMATVILDTILNSPYTEHFEDERIASNFVLENMRRHTELNKAAYIRYAEIFDLWKKNSPIFDAALTMNIYWRTTIATTDLSPRFYVSRLMTQRTREIPQREVEDAYVFISGIKKIHTDILRTVTKYRNDEFDTVIYCVYAPYELATLLGHYAETTLKGHKLSEGAILAVIDNTPHPDGKTKVSFRGFGGKECLELAKKFGGGGHNAAASAYISNFNIDMLGYKDE